MGGKQGASVSIHMLASQTRPFCRHTPPQSSRKHTVSPPDVTRPAASHRVPNRSITEVVVSIEGVTKPVEMEKKRGVGGAGWSCRETLINIEGDNKTPQGAGD